MATHNQVRVIGYLRKDPVIQNIGVEGVEKALFQIRTIHREVESYHGRQFEDIVIYYDGEELMPKIKNLKQFDVVDIKGVFNILTINKTSVCPYCGARNTKFRGTSTFIYPIHLMKRNGYQTMYDSDNSLPDAMLERHYKEISNQALIIGTVVSDPEMIEVSGESCCRYRLGVDRKYYINTQDDLKADYPWVYSYGAQAEWDFRHLVQGSVILVDGFIRTRKVEPPMKCDSCGGEYTYPDVMTEFVPYSLEYLSQYRTDEDIAREEELAKMPALQT